MAKMTIFLGGFLVLTILIGVLADQQLVRRRQARLAKK